MLSGAYVLTGHDGPFAVERFTCGDDEEGWSWSATRHDPVSGALRGSLRLQVGGEQRLQAEAGGWVLRAGTVGAEVLWRRGPDESACVADGLTGASPAFAVATARRLGLAPGERRRTWLLAVTEPVLAPMLVAQQWARVGPDRYDVLDLATGERQQLRLDGDVVEAPGLALTRA